MKKHTKILIIIVAILGFFVIIPKLMTYAKYVSNSIWNYYLESKEFYLESDYLESSEKININNNWDGKSVYFNIKNSLNDLKSTEYDITYKVTCTTDNQDITCDLNNTNSNIYEGVLSSYQKCLNEKDETDVSDLEQKQCEMSGYEWKNTVSEKEMFFDLKSDKEIENVNVSIKVESISPYKKTLNGIFKLQKEEQTEQNLTMAYKSFDQYSRLTVSNKSDENKCAILKWNSNNIQIDDTLLKETYEYEQDENKYINELKISVNKQSNMTFKFYELISNNYTTDDFTLIEYEC